MEREQDALKRREWISGVAGFFFAVLLAIVLLATTYGR